MKNLIIGLLFAMAVTANAKEKTKTEGEIVLTADNSILLNEVMMPDTTSKVMHQAQTMDAKLKSGEPIYLVLDTPGGSIQAGLEMISFLKALNRPVHTITFFAASMGFQTVQGLGTRYITHYGTLMAHKAKGQFSGEFPGQIDSRYVYYLRRLDDIDRHTVARSSGKLTMQSFKAMYENEYWVDGFDAVSKGLADEVVSVRCDQSLSGTKMDHFNFMGFDIRVKMSKCPAILGPLDVEAMIHTNLGLMTLAEFLSRGGSLNRVATSPLFPSSTAYGPIAAPVPEVTVEGLTIEKINEELSKIKARITNRKSVVIRE